MPEKKSTCPKCVQQSIRNKEDLIAKTEKSYGKIPSDEYLELWKKSKKDLYHNDTLSQISSTYFDEDDGRLVVSFKCECSVCGFIYNYNKELNVLEG